LKRTLKVKEIRVRILCVPFYPFVKKTYFFKNRSYNFEWKVIVAIPKMALPVFDLEAHRLPYGGLYR